MSRGYLLNPYAVRFGHPPSAGKAPFSKRRFLFNVYNGEPFCKRKFQYAECSFRIQRYTVWTYVGIWATVKKHRFPAQTVLFIISSYTASHLIEEVDRAFSTRRINAERAAYLRHSPCICLCDKERMTEALLKPDAAQFRSCLGCALQTSIKC